MTAYDYGDGYLWIRLIGRGILIKDTSKHPLLFSERHGYARGAIIGKWYFKLLKRA